MRRIAILGFALAALSATCAAAEPPSLQLSTYGRVKAGVVAETGTWFVLSDVGLRFLVDKPDDLGALARILEDSNKTSRSVTVVYDADGEFRGDDTPNYQVRALVYNGETVVVQSDVPPHLEPRNASETALARGVALGSAGRPREAHETLAPILSDPSLTTARRILALKADAAALSDDASDRLDPGEERDREFLAALAEIRARLALQPGNSDAQAEIASTLISLGDYDGALEILAAVLKSDPQDFWSGITSGAIYRTRKQYDLALAALDTMDAKGNGHGMAYHYHRGWTLQVMGREEDAIKEFTLGLQDQPDYAWAFERRACSYAALGELDHALADHKEALPRITAWTIGQPESRALTRDLKRAHEIGDVLEAALASDPHQKLSGLCAAYDEMTDGFRERSPLLPKN